MPGALNPLVCAKEAARRNLRLLLSAMPAFDTLRASGVIVADLLSISPKWFQTDVTAGMEATVAMPPSPKLSARSARSEPFAFQANSFQLSYDSRGPGRELGRGPGLRKCTKVIGERLTLACTPFALVHVHVQVHDRAASAAAPTFSRQGTYRLQPVVVQPCDSAGAMSRSCH